MLLFWGEERELEVNVLGLRHERGIELPVVSKPTRKRRPFYL
jgi:hypothetical protein